MIFTFMFLFQMNCAMEHRGDAVMGFSHEATTHAFKLSDDGGAIEVVANDPKDSKSIEVRNVGIDKGMAAKLLLYEKTVDFVLAVGDDLADEELFKVLPEKSYSIKVGLAKSYAKFNLKNHRDVIQLLTDLTKTINVP